MKTDAKLRGVVRSMRVEGAEWDTLQEQWKAPQYLNVTHFRADSLVETTEAHNRNGTVSRTRFHYDERGALLSTEFRLDDGPIGKRICRYDDLGRILLSAQLDADGTERELESYRYLDSGRKMKVQEVPKLDSPVICESGGCGNAVAYGVEGAESAYSAEGVAKLITHFDERGLPRETEFLNETGEPILRVVLAYDREGRLLKEESLCADRPPFSMPAEIEAIAGQLFASGTPMFTTIYSYDEKGRRIERRVTMSRMSTTRTTWEYDGHDNPVHEIEESTSGELNPDEHGKLQYVNEKSSRREIQFDYQYDSHGNWTERIVSARHEGNTFFQRSNIERRDIKYWDDPSSN